VRKAAEARFGAHCAVDSQRTHRAQLASPSLLIPQHSQYSTPSGLNAKLSRCWPLALIAQTFRRGAAQQTLIVSTVQEGGLNDDWRTVQQSLRMIEEAAEHTDL